MSLKVAFAPNFEAKKWVKVLSAHKTQPNHLWLPESLLAKIGYHSSFTFVNLLKEFLKLASYVSKQSLSTKTRVVRKKKVRFSAC